MKIETSENKITILLEDEKLDRYEVRDRHFGEKTKQIWIKLIEK